jgi:hypothetical protein
LGQRTGVIPHRRQAVETQTDIHALLDAVAEQDENLLGFPPESIAEARRAPRGVFSMDELTAFKSAAAPG